MTKSDVHVRVQCTHVHVHVQCTHVHVHVYSHFDDYYD